MSGLFARLSGGALFLLLFAVLAVLAWRTIPTTVAAVEPPQAAHDFAQAWRDGDLDRVSFDPASAPDVGEADSKLVAENVLAMVREISAVDLDHPIAVTPVGEPREQRVDQGELLAGDLVQQLEVSWDLGHQRRWTYRTELGVRETEGRERVLWRPSVVHPALAQGLALRASRLRPERAPILDATRAVVPTTLAQTLVGDTQTATAELAKAYPARVQPGDVIGVGGLQHVYDTQLAGTAGIEIDVVRVGDTPLQPPVRQVHVVPPVPGKPLQLSLDPGLQARAEAAVRGAARPTALVAVDALTGDVLADANAATAGRDIGLQGRYPPGSAFRAVTMLALVRHAGLSPSASLDCTPLAFRDQRFVNPGTAPGSGSVDVSTAFARNCITGFARASSALSDAQLRDAARALGIGERSATGTAAFDGMIPATDDALVVVQDAVGEGQVLVSPLAMARASAAIAVGVPRPPRLVVPLAASAGSSGRSDASGASATAEQDAATPAGLDGSEQAMLQQLLATSTATDDQLLPLRTASAGRVFAVAGTAGYGPAASAEAHAWCTGYQGNVAFAVFVAGDPATAASDTYRARGAAQVAADFLG